MTYDEILDSPLWWFDSPPWIQESPPDWLDDEDIQPWIQAQNID